MKVPNSHISDIQYLDNCGNQGTSVIGALSVVPGLPALDRAHCIYMLTCAISCAMSASLPQMKVCKSTSGI